MSTFLTRLVLKIYSLFQCRVYKFFNIYNNLHCSYNDIEQSALNKVTYSVKSYFDIDIEDWICPSHDRVTTLISVTVTLFGKRYIRHHYTH